MTANTAQPVSPFDLWAAAGFKADLLPIIPPGAPLTAKSSLDPSDTGKTPGLPMNSGKWTGFPKWAELHADDTHMAYWGKLHASHGVGVGLQARNFPGVDIDVLDAGVSDHIAVIADMVLGPAPERVGRAPKRLLAYAWDGTGEPIRKRRVEFFLPGDADTKHAVEVLGHGQQYVVEGIHPKTGNPYTWTGGKSPVGIGTAGLTPINGAMLDAFMVAVEQAVVQAGGAIHTRSSGTGALDRANVDQSGLSGDAARVREALEAMGNDCTYDEWITMSAAIKAALGGDESLYPIYEAWCLAYPGNTAEMARHKWDSLHPPYRVGAEYVYRKAAEKGWTGYAQHVFTVLSTEEFTPDDPEWLREWVYAVDQERFVRLSDKHMMAERQFARVMASPGISPTHKNNPAALFFQNPRRRMVRTLTYLPGGPDLCTVNGMSAVNVWMPAPVIADAKLRAATVTDADIAVWLDHMAFIIPDPVVRSHFLDWMAYVVQFPQMKPNWALFLGGGQGVGKGFVFLPLIDGAGKLNTSMVRPEDLAETFTDWLADKRLVMVEEMQNFDKRTVMNKLKVYITIPPEMVPVRKMHLPKYDIPNVACFVFMSNFRDALNLEDDDRRYLVYWSPARKQSAGYYTQLSSWLNGRGRGDVVAWLLARDVSAFAPIAHGSAPDTADKEEMKRNSGSDAVRLLLDMIETEQCPFHASVVNPMDAFTALGGAIGSVKLSPRHVEDAMRKAGGGMLPDPSGKGAMVIRGRRRDIRTGEVRETTVRVWACRKLDHWSGQHRAAIRREYEKGMGTADAGASLQAVAV